MDPCAVVFNYAVWAARYPELASSVDENLATAYFGEATLYLNNSCCSVVCGPEPRATLLNMITAHIAKLNATINGVPPSGLVGRISDASEGTVSVAVDYGTQSASAAWWLQTQYGASYWQATARYRRGRYVPGPPPSFNGFPVPGRFGGGGPPYGYG